MEILNPDLRVCLCSAVRQAGRQLTQAYDAALRPSGLRATQFVILMHVAGHGEMRLGDLGEKLGIDQTTLTRSLSLLEGRGLLEPAAAADRRERRVRVTVAGEAALAEAKPLWQAVQGEMHARLGGAEWRRIQHDLERVIAAAGGLAVMCGGE